MEHLWLAAEAAKGLAIFGSLAIVWVILNILFG
jgi:hypothetical protein